MYHSARTACRGIPSPCKPPGPAYSRTRGRQARIAHSWGPSPVALTSDELRAVPGGFVVGVVLGQVRCNVRMLVILGGQMKFFLCRVIERKQRGAIKMNCKLVVVE